MTDLNINVTAPMKMNMGGRPIADWDKMQEIETDIGIFVRMNHAGAGPWAVEEWDTKGGICYHICTTNSQGEKLFYGKPWTEKNDAIAICAALNYIERSRNEVK